MPDPIAAQNLYDALKDFMSSATRTRSLYDVLKDFQPLIASLVALLAATLAYQGAMAKVNLDRELNKREQMVRKLSLQVQFQAQLKRLRKITSDLKQLISDALDTKGILLQEVRRQAETIPFDDELHEIDNIVISSAFMASESRDQIVELRLFIREMADIVRYSPQLQNDKMRIGFAEELKKSCESVIDKVDFLTALVGDAIRKLEAAS
jgi:hypothetical protein